MLVSHEHPGSCKMTMYTNAVMQMTSQPEITPPLPYIIAGRKAIAGWFFASLAIPVFVAFLVSELDGKAFLFFLAAWGVIALLILATTIPTKIVLLHDGFVYTPSFGKSQKLRWSEVTSTSIEVLPVAATVYFTWNVQTFSGRHVDIQLGYFSRSDMRLFATQLIQHTKGAHISAKVQAIAEGRFPWWLF